MDQYSDWKRIVGYNTCTLNIDLLKIQYTESSAEIDPEQECKNKEVEAAIYHSKDLRNWPWTESSAEIQSFSHFPGYYMCAKTSIRGDDPIKVFNNLFTRWKQQ